MIIDIDQFLILIQFKIISFDVNVKKYDHLLPKKCLVRIKLILVEFSFH
jgi:hypothetical protein